MRLRRLTRISAATSATEKKVLFTDAPRILATPLITLLLGVLANLNLAGMWDLRAGNEFGTAVLGIPATPLAVYVTED